LDGWGLWFGEVESGMDGRFGEAEAIVDGVPLPLNRAIAGKVARAMTDEAAERISTGRKLVVFCEASKASAGEVDFIARRRGRFPQSRIALNPNGAGRFPPRAPSFAAR
jgi:hypothetical protein